MTLYTIYCHTHIESGRRYVGLTKKTMLRRWNGHLQSARRGFRTHFANAIRAHGKGAFSHEVLEVCTDLEVANLAEACWIEFYETRNPDKGFNLLPGGDFKPHSVSNPWDRPEFRKNGEAQLRRLHSDPVWCSKQKKDSISRAKDPEFRKKSGLIPKAKWQEPEYREKSVRAAMERAKGNSGAALRAANRARSQDEKWLALNAENWRRRGKEKSEAHEQKTHCTNGHEYTVENTVRRTRNLRKGCRTCINNTARLSRMRLKTKNKLNPTI